MTKEKRRRRVWRNVLTVWFGFTCALIVLWALNIIQWGALLMLVLSPFIVCAVVLPETNRRPSREYDWNKLPDDQRTGYFDYMNPLYAETPCSKRQGERNDDHSNPSVQNWSDSSHTNIICLDRNSDYSLNSTGTGTISSGLNDW